MINQLDKNSALRNLSALIDFSNLINSTLDINFTLNNILLTSLSKFHSTKALIALVNEDSFFEVRAYKGISKEIVDSFPKINIKNYLSNQKFNDFIKQNNFDLLQTIESSEGIRGFILLGKRLLNKSFEEDDIRFLKTLLNVGATAIENSLIVEKLKRVNKELDSKVTQLKSLFELSKEISCIRQPEAIGKLLAYTLMGQMLVAKYSIIIYYKDKINILESNIDENLLKSFFIESRIDKIEKPISINDEKSNYKVLIELGIELLIPMQIQNKTKGIILLGKRKNNKEFTKSDIEFIYSLGNMAIISIENARMLEEIIEKERLEKDLEIARNIQKNLLPKSIPQFPNLIVTAYNKSAKIVGGDYYDIIQLDDKKLLLAIADVSGKGVPAALLMANLQAFLKSICKQKLPLDKATDLINDLVVENTTMGSFITFFWCIFDSITKELTYVNAGHNPPLLVRNGKIIKLKKGGMILGFLPTTIPYIAETIQLQEGDIVLLFTDGITEAMNKSLIEYSDERLEHLIIKNYNNEPEKILEKVKMSLEEFTEGAEQSDDITCIIAKVR